jgi:hypothetical protein
MNIYSQRFLLSGSSHSIQIYLVKNSELQRPSFNLHSLFTRRHLIKLYKLVKSRTLLAGSVINTVHSFQNNVAKGELNAEIYT